MKSDAYIKAYFFNTNEGGRNIPITICNYGCPIFIDGDAFECRFNFSEDPELVLSKEHIIPIKFLRYDLVSHRLEVGKEISLWEGKIIAVGEIFEICNH